MELISIKNLSFSYDGKIAIEGINFSINKGDYICIIGENGAGKSTLIKGILKLKKQESGEIIFKNGLKANEIGYLPQQNNSQKDFPASVEEIVLSGYLNKLKFKPFYSKKEKINAYENMKKVGIFELKNKCFKNLSGGQQQRALLARALCATSKVILFDEPTTGLDHLVIQDFYNLIEKINKEMDITVVMVSHNIEYVLKYASHILQIQSKQLFFGKTKEYIQSDIGKTFLKGTNLC